MAAPRGTTRRSLAAQHSATASIVSSTTTRFGAARTFGAGAGEGKEYIVDITQENISEEVMNSEVPVILDCYADWCGPCRRLTPMLEEAVANAEGKLKVGLVVGVRWAAVGTRGGAAFVLKEGATNQQPQR